MATILVIANDEAVLEGLAQLLAGAGHSTRLAHSCEDGLDLARLEPPLAVVAQRALVLEEPLLLRTPLAAGGAVILCHVESERAITLAPALARIVLADLTLPLERNRLLALIQRMDQRARATGRVPQQPPEQRA